MLIKSALIASGSGSVGGLTLSRNSAGMYFRARTIPVNPATAQQVEIRTILGNLAAAWQTLTVAQRTAWTTYATNVPIVGKLGDPLTLTGQQMYIRCNSARVQAGLDRVDAGPTTYSMDSLSPVVVECTGGSPTYTVAFNDEDEWVSEDSAALLIYGSRQFAPTVNFFKGPYRFAGGIDGDSVTAPTSPDTSISVPFVYTADNHVAFRALSIRADGRISPVQFIGPQLIVSA